MVRTLGDFVEQKMAELGLNQTELAARCGIPRLTINRLVTKKTALPDAETRRKLAKGMGVSHLDILVAAGELEPDEVEAAGVRGVVEERPAPEGIATVLREIVWTPQTTQLVTNQLHFIRDAQRGTYDVSDPREADRDWEPGNE